jgi:hypothetical protein
MARRRTVTRNAAVGTKASFHTLRAMAVTNDRLTKAVIKQRREDIRLLTELQKKNAKVIAIVNRQLAA